jgi:large subunit ribosomal protein L18
MDANRKKRAQRGRRKVRVRKRVYGTPDHPRLTVFRSLKNIYAQIIDDSQGRTLVAASTGDKAVREKVGYGGNKAAAAVTGARLAELAKEKGIARVAFDRNGYRYHGRVKELADAARKGGLTF